jgi:hypothetical protein
MAPAWGGEPGISRNGGGTIAESLLARTAVKTSRTFALSISAISSGEINVGAGSGYLQRLENVCQINGDHRLSCCRKMVYRELLFLNTAPPWGGFGAKLT